MLLLDQLQHLSPPLSFCALLACGFLVGLINLILVRVVVRALGIGKDQVLPVRDTLITGFTGLFALMVAFSAAGIWNDAIQARATVQREANAIENVIALGSGLPEELAKQVHDAALQIGRFTVEEDWPAMQHRVGPNEDLLESFNQSPIVRLIILISRNAKDIAGAPASALLSQLVELRSARVQREAIARGGISGVLWLTLLPCLSGCHPQPLAVVFGHAHGRSPAWQSSVPTIAPRVPATFSRRRGLRRLPGEGSLERRVCLPPLSGGGRAVPLRKSSWRLALPQVPP